MEPDHPDDGFTGLVHGDGRVEIDIWVGGERVRSYDADPKALGGMAAALLMMAHESAERTGAKPNEPSKLSGSHPDHPSIPTSAYGLIVSKKKKTFALGFVVGEAQIAFQMPQSILAYLGHQLLAASAKSDRPQ